MPQSKMQGDQLVNEAALSILRQAARTEQRNINAAIDQNFGSPLRMFASNPSDAILNFSPQEIQLADGTGKSVPPVSSTIPTVAASTINFQTGATTGATFSGLTFPTTTVGQFRRLGFSLLASGQISCIWSAAAASLGALANPGTLFVPTGVPIGWIDLEATAATAYKTAGSATAIVENAVGGSARVHVFGSGGSGGGSGNANSFLIELEDRLGSSYFQCFTPNIFAIDGTTKVDNTSTGSYDIANQVYSLPTIGNKLVSSQMYDATFLASLADSVQTELQALWGTYDPSAIYRVSRDGGLNWTILSMSRIGSSLKSRGIGVFPAPSVLASLVTYDVANADSSDALNATTQQQIAVSFTVDAGAKWRTANLRAFVNKTGSPLGTVWAQIVKDAAGSPSASTDDIVCETAQVSIATIGAGNQNLDFAVTQPLPAGTYWMVLKTDATYKASFSAGVTQLAWRSDASAPSYAGAYVANNGTAWSAIAGKDATFLIQGIVYDLRVEVTSATANVSLYGYGIFYEEDTLTLPADNEEYQAFDVDGNSDQTSFTVTNFNVSPRTLKVYDVDNDAVYRFPKFAVNGNIVVFPAGTFLAPGKTLRVIFEQSPMKQGFITDKLSALLAANGLGSSDTNFDLSAAGVGLKLRSPDGTKWHVRITNAGAIETIANGW